MAMEIHETGSKNKSFAVERVRIGRIVEAPNRGDATIPEQDIADAVESSCAVHQARALDN
jgi:hypothetical protein